MSAEPPVEWLSKTFIALVASSINVTILIKECKKRNSKDIKFTTKSLKVFSLLAIICGTLYSIAHITYYFPVFCTFTDVILYSLQMNQCAFIGMYQLSRIYYCFSQNQVYSGKGYPNWLFIIMYTIGISLAVNGCIYPFILMVASWNNQCGINNKWHYIENTSLSLENPTVSLWIHISAFIYIIWDVFTLLLYGMKVYSFRRYKSQQIEVYNRIMSILSRILILTVLYEIPAVLSILIGVFRDMVTNNHTLISIRIIYTFSFISASTIGNYSMYLMQQHNDEEYHKFLNVLYKLKVYYICCCKSAITETLNESEQNTTKIIEMNAANKNKDNQENGAENSETGDPSIKNAHSLVQETSISTHTVNPEIKIETGTMDIITE